MQAHSFLYDAALQTQAKRSPQRQGDCGNADWHGRSMPVLYVRCTKLRAAWQNSNGYMTTTISKSKAALEKSATITRLVAIFRQPQIPWAAILYLTDVRSYMVLIFFLLVWILTCFTTEMLIFAHLVLYLTQLGRSQCIWYMLHTTFLRSEHSILTHICPRACQGARFKVHCIACSSACPEQWYWHKLYAARCISTVVYQNCHITSKPH